MLILRFSIQNVHFKTCFYTQNGSNVLKDIKSCEIGHAMLKQTFSSVRVSLMAQRKRLTEKINS